MRAADRPRASRTRSGPPSSGVTQHAALRARELGDDTRATAPPA